MMRFFLHVLTLVALVLAAAPGSPVSAQPAPPSNPAPADAAADSEPLAAGPWQEFDRGGGNNVVIVDNDKDGRFAGRGNAELDRVHGDTVTPTNSAEAHAQCTDCQTIAVALQVALYQRGAPTIAPINRAVALNTDCTRCLTVARASQYVIPVDDLDHVPHQLNELVRRVDRELTFLQRSKDLDTADPQAIQAHMDQLEADFASLQQYVSDLTDTKQDTTSPPGGAADLAPRPEV